MTGHVARLLLAATKACKQKLVHSYDHEYAKRFLCVMHAQEQLKPGRRQKGDRSTWSRPRYDLCPEACKPNPENRLRPR